METSTVPAIGQAAPDFRLKGPGGTNYTLAEYQGQQNVLLVFYPLAFSPVCSHQLPEIQKDLALFEAANTAVFGVSVDSHYTNAAFARTLGLRFPLLSDWKREASAAYGVLIPEAGYSGRAIFAIDRQGVLVWSEISENMGSVDALPSTRRALEALAQR